MATILVVEDESSLRSLIKLWLEREGHTCHLTGDGKAVLRLFYELHPDMVLLDIALPGMDGWELCGRIREASAVPIIMLTAKADEPSKVRGLQMGADDYVTKPFGFPELLARIQAVLRRASMGGQTHEIFTEGDLLLDPESHRAILRGTDLKLTPTEYRLLAFLMQHSGQLLTHRQILNAVWGPAYTSEYDSLRIYIRNLRRKLEGDSGSGTRYIATEHGLGYRFVRQPAKTGETPATG